MRSTHQTAGHQPGAQPRTLTVEHASPLPVRGSLGKRLRTAEILLNASRRFAAIGTLDEMLEALIETATSELGAERGTLFLNDPTTGELYSRIAQGNFRREIRLLNTTGIAGDVFTTGRGLIIHDVYADERFNRSIDEQTGYQTRSVICAPMRTVKGEVIGVAQVLNKVEGEFDEEDLVLLEAIATQATFPLQSIQLIERMERARVQELEFLDVVADITANIELGSLLQKVMGEVTRMLNAERSTLFLNDEKTGELWSEVGQGLTASKIRFPNHMGIAGAVFTSGKTVNIPYAYADLRFNPSFDKATGFFTRSILAVPVVNQNGKVIGVTQVLNKRGGPFNDEDASRLKAFTAQVAIGLENAKLFADVQNMKNYNEAMLESMTNGVVTLDGEGKIVTCNAAGLRILRARPEEVLQRQAAEFFVGPNAWIVEKLAQIAKTQDADITMDAELECGGDRISVNVTVQPLVSAEQKTIGSMVMLEDISSEKRMKATMSRYMDPSLANKLLAGGGDILGGQSVNATVLFSDVRGFTTLTEELGAQGTVSLLNEYFTIMVDCLQRGGGMLDKFIGDAIMAAFGMPVAGEDDEDRAVRTAIAMIRELDAWNALRAAEGKRTIDMGIGLNSDLVVAGNIGSPKRMDYTMIGDGVNLAARLESACKQYGSRILISENTQRKLRGTYVMREADLVVVKGKTKPVAIYEVLDFHTEETYPHMFDALNHYRNGLRKYRDQRFADAEDSFNEALAINPADQLAKLYLGRCAALKAAPPCEDWDGVWVMKDK